MLHINKELDSEREHSHSLEKLLTESKAEEGSIEPEAERIKETLKPNVNQADDDQEVNSLSQQLRRERELLAQARAALEESRSVVELLQVRIARMCVYVCISMHA